MPSSISLSRLFRTASWCLLPGPAFATAGSRVSFVPPPSAEATPTPAMTPASAVSAAPSRIRRRREGEAWAARPGDAGTGRAPDEGSGQEVG